MKFSEKPKNTPYYLIAAINNPTFWPPSNKLFLPGDDDGIVTVESALGGPHDLKSEPIRMSEKLAHTKMPEDSDNYFEVLKYLRMPPPGNPPIANFFATPTSITVGGSIQFTDQSSNDPTSWSWNFGDGTTSSQQNPVKVYNTVGTFTVSLVVTNNFGSTTNTKQNYLVVSGNIVKPTVSTSSITNITQTTATGGGNVTADGGAAVTARGICWSTNPNPTTANNKTTNGTGTGSFTSNLTGLTANTPYYVRAYATNSAGTAYGSQVTFTTGQTISLPTVTTTAITAITQTTATGGGNVTATGGATVTARGICWSTNPNPTTANSKTTNGTGTGSFTSNLTGLTANTPYYVRAYATNSAGTAYGSQVTFTTKEEQGGEGTQVVAVTNPATGKTWMDRNLGAARAATSSTDAEAYGHLYQWGRAADGHQKRDSPTTSSLSSGDTPGHGNFILAPNSPYDWRSPQNTNLWQGVNGKNNPCPTGYRLPTEAELNAERASWSSNNSAGAFSSPLKLPMAGGRYNVNGSLNDVGSFGYYWSSTVDGTYSRYLLFSGSSANVSNSRRAYGLSVRCLKD